MKSPFKVLFSCVILSGVIGTTVYAGSNKTEDSNQLVDKNPAVQILIDKNPNMDSALEHVAFKESKESKEVEAGLRIDHNKLDGTYFQEYKKQMKQYAKDLRSQGSSKASATITFKSPLKVEEFEELIKNNNIELERFNIRTVDENGVIGSISGIPNNSELVPQETLTEVLAGVQANFVGIYSVVGNVFTDEADYNKLEADPNVFLADVSHDIIQNEVLNSKKFKELKMQDSKHHVDVNVSDFYWYLENQK